MEFLKDLSSRLLETWKPLSRELPCPASQCADPREETPVTYLWDAAILWVFSRVVDKVAGYGSGGQSCDAPIAQVYEICMYVCLEQVEANSGPKLIHNCLFTCLSASTCLSIFPICSPLSTCRPVFLCLSHFANLSKLLFPLFSPLCCCSSN